MRKSVLEAKGVLTTLVMVAVGLLWPEPRLPVERVGLSRSLMPGRLVTPRRGRWSPPAPSRLGSTTCGASSSGSISAGHFLAVQVTTSNGAANTTWNVTFEY